MNDTKDAAEITRIVREMTKKPRSWRSTAAYALAHAPCGIPSKHAKTMRSTPPLRALLEAVAAGCDVVPPEIAEAAVAASEGRETAPGHMSVQQQISETCRDLLALGNAPEAAFRAHRLLWLNLIYAGPLRDGAQAMRRDLALRAFLEDLEAGRDPKEGIGYEAAVRAAEGREMAYPVAGPDQRLLRVQANLDDAEKSLAWLTKNMVTLQECLGAVTRNITALEGDMVALRRELEDSQ